MPIVQSAQRNADANVLLGGLYSGREVRYGESRRQWRHVALSNRGVECGTKGHAQCRSLVWWRHWKCVATWLVGCMQRTEADVVARDLSHINSLRLGRISCKCLWTHSNGSLQMDLPRWRYRQSRVNRPGRVHRYRWYRCWRSDKFCPVVSASDIQTPEAVRSSRWAGPVCTVRQPGMSDFGGSCRYNDY